MSVGTPARRAQFRSAWTFVVIRGSGAVRIGRLAMSAEVAANALIVDRATVTHTLFVAANHPTARGLDNNSPLE